MFTADRPTSTPCPVAPLAHEAARLIRSLHRHDGVSPHRYDAATSRLSHMERTACDLPARSQEGLFYQACIAYGAVEAVHSWVPDEDKAAAWTMRAQVEGAALSLARALTVPSLRELTDYYLPGEVAMQVAA